MKGLSHERIFLSAPPRRWKGARKSPYKGKCQLCHGANGEGDGPAASARSPSPANIKNPGFWQGDPEKKITESVRNGKGPMPAFTLSPDEINEIIDCMSHTFKKSWCGPRSSGRRITPQMKLNTFKTNADYFYTSPYGMLGGAGSCSDTSRWKGSETPLFLFQGPFRELSYNLREEENDRLRL